MPSAVFATAYAANNRMTSVIKPPADSERGHQCCSVQIPSQTKCCQCPGYCWLGLNSACAKIVPVSFVFVRKNRVKEKLQRGEIVTGMEHWSRSPKVIELLGYAGFDFVHIDNEHVAHDWETVENLIRTAESVGLTPLFRTEQCFNGPPVDMIIKALKCGAQIIKVPHVNTREDAKKAVEAVKYPPMGRRGIVTIDRSARETVYSELRPPGFLKDFVQQSNEETMVWAIVESVEAVENLDEILSVAGIDAVGFGFEDYAISAGLSSSSAPEVSEAREKVREGALRRGKQMWWHIGAIPTVEQIHDQISKGIRIFQIGIDIQFLNIAFRSIMRNVQKAKEA